jgi:hypothetical protein
MVQTDAGHSEAEVTGPASPRFGHDVSRIPLHPPAAGAIQTKLAINAPGDRSEQDADRVAEHVMRTPEPPLQRASPCGGGGPTGHTAQPGWAPERVQQNGVQAGPTGEGAAPPSVHAVLRSPGQPLDPATRAFMEPRFGSDFSRVRVHTGATAEESAREVNAHAYAVGQDIVFGASRFAPETQEGRRLLAHELTHVQHQEGASALRIFRQPDLTASGLTPTMPEPRSLHVSLDVGDLEADELDQEIERIQQWLNAHPERSESEYLRSELKRLQSAPKPQTGSFLIRFSQAWGQAEEALRKEVRRRDKESYGSSITRGLMKVKDLAVSPEEVWKHGLAANLFLRREKQLVEAWSQALASKTFSKRYDAAKYGRIYDTERYYQSSSKRRDDDTEIWSRGVAYGLFLPTEKAAVLRIPPAGVLRAGVLTQRIKTVDPKSPEVAKLIDEIHDFTSDPAIVLLGPEVEKLLGPFGYTYRDRVEAHDVAHDINTAYQKSLEPNQVRKVTDAPVQVRWDECMRRRSLGVNNLEAAEFDPACFRSEDEFQQELIRRSQEFRTRYQGCGHSRPSHFKCRDEVAAEYFPAGQARQDAIRRWAYGELEIYKGVVQGGVVSQSGFHFAHDVLGWSTERSAAFGGALSTGTSLGLGYVQRRAVLQKPPANAPPPPTATTEVVGKPEPMPKPDAPVVKGAPNAPVKPPVEFKPPPALTPDPVQKALPPPDTRQLTLDIKQAQQRYDRLREKASQAEKDYAKRLRNTVRAMKRRGQQLIPQEADLLATKLKLEQARDDALSKLNQAKEKLRVLQPSEGAPKHGQAGLAQEPKYLDELRGRGLRAQLTDKNTPVIDAAIVGTPEVHSVKSIVPSQGSEVAVQRAENDSPRDLADRVSRHITKALVDRRSDKWSRLRNRWNNTMRTRYHDQFGYELPKNPDDISFVVDVRVVTAKAPSPTAQQAVEAAVAAWLKKNERVPPGFTWRISYVSNE